MPTRCSLEATKESQSKKGGRWFNYAESNLNCVIIIEQIDKVSGCNCAPFGSECFNKLSA